MINYPQFFLASMSSSGPELGPWQINASSYRGECSVPESFAGPGGAFSPEDYYLLSVMNCFAGTFKVYAKYSKLNYQELSINSKLIVDKDEYSLPCMKAVELEVNLSGITDLKKTRLLIDKTLQNGFILRSINTVITTKVKVDNVELAS